MESTRSYTLDLQWTGKSDNPRAYDRSYIISGEGKTEIPGSADPASRGDSKKWNPEEMLLASLASCYMLWYLYLCSISKIVITYYHDHPTALMKVDSEGRGNLAEATLNPQVIIADASRIDDAIKIEAEAHAKCSIANAVNFKVNVNAKVKSA